MRNSANEMFQKLEERRKAPLQDTIEWYLDHVFAHMESHVPTSNMYKFGFDTVTMFSNQTPEIKAICAEVVSGAVAQLKHYGYDVTYINDHGLTGILVSVAEPDKIEN